MKEAYQQFHAEYEKAVQEAAAIKEQAVNEAATLRQQAGKNGQAVEGYDQQFAETVLAELREEAEQMRLQLTGKLTAESERAAKAEAQIKAFQTELADLQKQLKQREEILDHLKAELKRRDEKARLLATKGDLEMQAPERMLALVEKLQKDVVERDAQISELHRKMQPLQELSDPEDKVGYGEELNRFRVELEQDRAWLNEELARLQVFKAEIDETRQEEELRISRERVEVAREWAEINRIREQLRRDSTKPDKGDTLARERAKVKQPTKGESVEVNPAASRWPNRRRHSPI